MTFVQAIIMGLVEGFTEFLPISSTAHLMFASKILNIAQSDFVKSFEIIIQLGAILAVIVMFGSFLLKNTWLWKKITVAFIPTAVIGFVLYKTIKTYLVGNLVLAAISLIVGGIALILVDLLYTKRMAKNTQNGSIGSDESGLQNITTKQAIIIGTVQSLAVIPGISRAAATIIPAMLFGSSRKAAAQFSFLLAIPTVAAAAGYDILKNFGTIRESGNLGILAVGFITSFIAAIFSIKFFLSYVQKHSFKAIGIYRIIAAVLFLGYILVLIP